MGRRVTTPSMVVPLEPVANVVGDADVVARGIGGTSDDVDDSLFNSIHASPTGMDQAQREIEQSLRSCAFVRRICDLESEIGLREFQSGEEVRLRSLHELRRDSLRLEETRLPSRSSAQPSEGWLTALDDFATGSSVWPEHRAKAPLHQYGLLGRRKPARSR